MPREISIVLDGRVGEGGGQVLRTALSLSATTGRPFAVHHLRANRIKPGLRPQHREAVLATALLCAAEVEGAEVGSSRVEFRPTRPAAPGEHTFDLGTAGSAPLLFQTLCWPLALAGSPSQLPIRGGTHQLHSPTFHDLSLVWAPAVARLGFRFELALQAAGFYPEGGGEMTAAIQPAHAMPPLDLRHRGTLTTVEVVAMVAGLPFAVAERLAERALRRLRDAGIAADATRVPVPARLSAGAPPPPRRRGGPPLPSLPRGRGSGRAAPGGSAPRAGRPGGGGARAAASRHRPDHPLHRLPGEQAPPHPVGGREAGPRRGGGRARARGARGRGSGAGSRLGARGGAAPGAGLP